MSGYLDKIKDYYRKNKVNAVLLMLVGITLVTVGIVYWNKNREKKTFIPLSEVVTLSKSSYFSEMIADNPQLKLTVKEGIKATTKDMDGKVVTLSGGELLYADIGYLQISDLTDIGLVLPKTYSEGKIGSGVPDWVSSLIPLVLMLALLYLIYSGNLFGLAGTKFKRGKNAVGFTDIGGISEVKDSLKEVVSFLNNSEFYAKLGATIPRGVLLVGAPGTGKTMLAQAVATEANVPFYYASGSEFHNMWVGMAAMRVKRLFKTASKTASVIFIDEFDSIAHRRGTSGTDAGREWNHTLNQLLAEMDGFKKNTRVIVMAATNRVDVLDPAVMRAGRFDRKIMISLPNYEARCEILRIHGTKKKLSKTVNLEIIARQTSGFSGADLALLLNEAAILAGKEQSNFIKMPHLFGAIDKVLVGDERKGFSITPEDRRVLAYHEAGHAVVASFVPQGDRVQRITILPHGYAGGFTRTSQDKETMILSKTKGLSNVATLLGGRVAEEIVIGDISSGAENDLKQANELACEMVKHYGMSEEYGLRYCTQNAMGLNELGGDAQKMVDSGINDILTKSSEMARVIVTKQRLALDKIAEKLLEAETLDGNEIENLIKESTTDLAK